MSRLSCSHSQLGRQGCSLPSNPGALPGVPRCSLRCTHHRLHSPPRWPDYLRVILSLFSKVCWGSQVWASQHMAISGATGVGAFRPVRPQEKSSRCFWERSQERTTGEVSLQIAMYEDKAWNGCSRLAPHWFIKKVQRFIKKAGNCQTLIKPYLISTLSPDHFSYIGQYITQFRNGFSLHSNQKPPDAPVAPPTQAPPSQGWERAFLWALAAPSSITALLRLHLVSVSLTHPCKFTDRQAVSDSPQRPNIYHPQGWECLLNKRTDKRHTTESSILDIPNGVLPTVQGHSPCWPHSIASRLLCPWRGHSWGPCQSLHHTTQTHQGRGVSGPLLSYGMLNPMLSTLRPIALAQTALPESGLPTTQFIISWHPLSTNTCL